MRAALQELLDSDKEAKEAQRQRDKELAAVTIHEPDVAVLAEEFQLDEKAAELLLREQEGSLEKALRHCMAN